VSMVRPLHLSITRDESSQSTSAGASLRVTFSSLWIQSSSALSERSVAPACFSAVRTA
jgi:hypothetical protein